ncbi:MAG: hypothetical protein RIT81_00725 [Deltaproteobacteria bacterium]
MISILALALAAQSPSIDRDTVLASAKSYAAHRWTMAEKNNLASCTTKSYESDYSPGPQTSVPYAWGGAMSLDTFDKKLADGDAAGSHSWHGILSCVAGVDCSGFVCQVWKSEKRYSTSSISAITKEITIEDLKPGDAFNKPGKHIVLFAGYNDAGEPTFYEAAGGASRVRLHSGWSYLNGYTPIRYVHIVDAPPVRANAEAAETTPATPTLEQTSSVTTVVIVALLGAAVLAGGLFLMRRRR